MATFEDIMLGLKSQEGDDKKEEFSNALLGQVTPTITAQVPGIENITLGQAPIVSQEGIQYQTPDVFSNIGLGSARGVTPRDMSRPEQVIPAGRFGGQSEARVTDLSPSEVQGRGRIAPSGYGTQTVLGATVPETTDQLLGQVTPTIQSITETEQAQEQAPQPQATFTSPFEGSGLTTVGGASLSEFLSGAAMPEQGFARAERQMAGRGTTLTPEQFNELSAQRVARMEAKPDFMMAVSDRERRGTSEMSMASATKLAGGDRDKARAMIELQRQGRDPMTGREVEAPFEPKEIEIGGKKYIQYTPNYIQPVEEPKASEPKAPKKSEIESIREEGVKAGLPENLIRQSIASKLGLDLFDEGVKNWMAGNTDTIPSVEGESESSTFDPTSLTGEDKEAYDWAMANPNAPQSAQILARLSK